ncbi:MAG: hypothetical protein Q8S73_25630 [Deltaproteobacteria bacterium]|nr:hypothetical protein [Myxococcales bacterium]MDP3217519.1 hypothetical protein [Deltaproteobacteria bacterium]
MTDRHFALILSAGTLLGCIGGQNPRRSPLDYPITSVCREPPSEVSVGAAPVLIVGLFEASGRPFCPTATVVARFQGRNQTLDRFAGDTTAFQLVRGRLVPDRVENAGCSNAYTRFAMGSLYALCTDDTLEVEVSSAGCSTQTVRMTWWDYEQIEGNAGDSGWSVPVQLRCGTHPM